MEPVRLTRRVVSMDTYGQGPLNPHPTFPQWSTWPVYPYQYYGHMIKQVTRERYLLPPGYPATRPPDPKSREPLDEIVAYDGWT